MSTRADVLGSLLQERSFHGFDPGRHPRGAHGRWAATFHNADDKLRSNFRASDERVKPHVAEHILHKTANMDTETAAKALGSGKVKDTLSQWAPGGRVHPDRERLHKQIIRKALEGHEAQPRPRAIFTAGGSASGKTVLRSMKGDPKAVIVDPDEVKKQLPEYKQLADAGRADIAAAATHEEASHIAGLIGRLAVERHHHVVIDGVGDSEPRKFAGKVKAARDAGYETEIRYAHVPLSTALERNQERFRKTGRLVEPSILKAKHKGVATRYMEDIRNLRGVHVRVFDTGGPKGAAPALISERDRAGKLKVYNPAKQRQFEEKAR